MLFPWFPVRCLSTFVAFSALPVLSVCLSLPHWVKSIRHKMATVMENSGFMFFIFCFCLSVSAVPLRCYLLLSFTLMGFSLRASRSWDWAHFIPRWRMFLLPPMCMLGKRPFFFMIIVIASKTKLIAIINSANIKVLNIFVIFVSISCLCGIALL